LIFIVAYHAEATVRNVLSRIPHSLAEDYETEVLVIDDGSSDRTFERALAASGESALPFPVTVLFNPVNQGYGGNQKIGYFYALRKGFDFVALLHGDGQYSPERLPELVRPLRDGRAGACFGSRMMTKGAALRGGMPIYKFLGNKILSWFENRMLRTAFTEFHSGYRVYSTAALKRIPFDLNTNDFHFDTEIIVQFVLAGLEIVEVPIPTYYGDEICRVNGLKYAWNVAVAVTKARLQELGLFYDPRFDCAKTGRGNEQYQLKLDYESPHSLALEAVTANSRVLDLGCAGGYMGSTLKKLKSCHVVGVDSCALDPSAEFDGFRQHDLNQGLPDVEMDAFDYVLLLDIIEHLSSPELFVRQLRQGLKLSPEIKILVSTGNIGFVVTRFMLLIGQFNYGKRGILDHTHTRLFTFASLRRLFEQAGFHILETRGVPGPFPLAMGDNRFSRLLMRLNRLLISLSKGLFSYQIFMVLQPRPSLELLLKAAEEQSRVRASF
jgi:glycosyltransferase involved in cell wall biosynthesis